MIFATAQNLGAATPALLSMITVYVNKRRSEGATDFQILSEIKQSPIYGYADGNLLDADIQAAFTAATAPAAATSPPTPKKSHTSLVLFIVGAVLVVGGGTIFAVSRIRRRHRALAA